MRVAARRASTGLRCGESWRIFGYSSRTSASNCSARGWARGLLSSVTSISRRRGVARWCVVGTTNHSVPVSTPAPRSGVRPVTRRRSVTSTCRGLRELQSWYGDCCGQFVSSRCVAPGLIVCLARRRGVPTIDSLATWPCESSPAATASNGGCGVSDLPPTAAPFVRRSRMVGCASSDWMAPVAVGFPWRALPTTGTCCRMTDWISFDEWRIRPDRRRWCECLTRSTGRTQLNAVSHSAQQFQPLGRERLPSRWHRCESPLFAGGLKRQPASFVAVCHPGADGSEPPPLGRPSLRTNGRWRCGQVIRRATFTLSSFGELRDDLLDVPRHAPAVGEFSRTHDGRVCGSHAIRRKARPRGCSRVGAELA